MVNYLRTELKKIWQTEKRLQMSSKKKILYICDVPEWAGSTLSLRELISSVRDVITPIVIVPQKNEVYDYFISLGVECHQFRYFLVYFGAAHRFSVRYCLKYLLQIIKIFINILVAFKVAIKFKKEDITIVHTNTSAIDIGFLISRLLHAKHIWHIREMLNMFNDARFTLFSYRCLKWKIGHSDVIVFISNAVKQHWAIHGSAQQVVMGDAVRSKYDVCYEPLKESFYISGAACLCDFKGMDYIVENFCKNKKSIRGEKLVLFGKCTDSYRQKLLSISEKYNQSEQIVFIGAVQQEELKYYLSHALAFLQCSKIEGLGRTTIEAMFYGCPVIARDNGGSLDFVINDVTGLLFHTENDFMNKLNEVVEKDMSQIIQNAQRLVCERYNLEEYGERIMSVYNQVMFVYRG